MQLVLLAPAIGGLALAIGSLAYAHWVISHRRAALADTAETKPPNPYKLGPPAIEATVGGTVQSHAVAEIQERVLTF